MKSNVSLLWGLVTLRHPEWELDCPDLRFKSLSLWTLASDGQKNYIFYKIEDPHVPQVDLLAHVHYTIQG